MEYSIYSSVIPPKRISPVFKYNGEYYTKESLRKHIIKTLNINHLNNPN